jgi:hypothetical protein
MIDVKEAVRLAKEKAADILGVGSTSLEEFERDIYKDRDVWSITLSVPREVSQLSPFAKLLAGVVQYKRFVIDVESGELVAMKVRGLAS